MAKYKRKGQHFSDIIPAVLTRIDNRRRQKEEIELSDRQVREANEGSIYALCATLTPPESEGSMVFVEKRPRTGNCPESTSN